MGAIITCCKDCQERHGGCHATCEKYIAQKAEHEAKKAEYREKRMMGVAEQRCDNLYKAMRRKGRR